MNPDTSFQPYPPLDALLGPLCANEWSPQQAAELGALLATDDRACEAYVWQMHLHGELLWRYGHQRAASQALPEPQVSFEANLLPVAPASTLVNPWRLAFPARVVALAACLLLIGYFAAMVVMVAWSRSKPVVAERTEERAVATITASEEAVWLQDSEITPSNPRPRPGAKWSDPKAEITPDEPLSIQSGLVVLQLKQGATLFIEGPADWQITGDNSATLKHGKLVARVPSQAIGFTLDTPTARIVDLGTEFGVAVDTAGDSDVHMIAGEVTIEVPNAKTQQPPLRLEKGQAYQVRREGPPRAIPFSGRSFEKLAAALERGRLPRLVLISGGMPVTSDFTFTQPDGSTPFNPQALTDGRLGDGNLGDDYFYWVARGGGPAEFIVDLQAEREVAAIQLLNTHNGKSQDRGTRDFRISFSTDGRRYTPVLEGTLESVLFIESPQPERFEIKPPTLTRYVKFEALSCYGRSAGLNEIQVFGLPLEQKRRSVRP